MIRKLKSAQSGFTLVEILIVVALIAILAVVALVTINPAEAQRRARDSQRLKDAATLQSIMEQAISDHGTGLTTAFTATSDHANGNDCSSGWLATAMSTSLCAYANTLPLDPMNRSGQIASGGLTTNALLHYQVTFDTNAQYRICNHFESLSNDAKLSGDNGSSVEFFEIYSSTAAANCTSR